MILQNKNMNVEDFLDTLDKEKYIYVNKNKKRYINASYTNESQILEYPRSVSFIINDDDYKKIKDGLGEDALSYDHLIMLKDHKDYKSFNSISNKLKELNGEKEDLSIQLRTLQFKQERLMVCFLITRNKYIREANC